MRYGYFVPDRFDEFAQKCQKIVRYQENGAILFIPKTDRSWRINQLIQDYKFNVPLYRLDFNPEETEFAEDVEFQIKKHLGNEAFKSKSCIIICNGEHFIHGKNYDLINDLTNIKGNMSNISFIFCFEVDVTHPDIAKYFSQTSIFSNIIYYPLYNYSDSLNFFNYLVGKWSFSIRESVKDKLVRQCGGHFWFLKHAIRAIRDNPDLSCEEIVESDDMQFRVGQVVDALSEYERTVLNKIIRNQTISLPQERHSQSYLTKMGIIKDEKIAIPLMESYLRSNQPKINISISEDKILLNDVNVENNFSRKEKRALKSLLENRGEIVTREQIAKAIWPIDTEEHYTDWAVDRLISRLRVKLNKLGMPKELIKTYRNRGYMLLS